MSSVTNAFFCNSCCIRSLLLSGGVVLSVAIQLVRSAFIHTGNAANEAANKQLGIKWDARSE
eukprot:6165350-Amphidinium_carterae.1